MIDWPRSETKRTAFTLVELMVSILLMAALLTAAWTMLHSFGDRFERTQQRVERTQLIRALHQVLESDLSSCLVSRNRRPRSGQESLGGLFAPLDRTRLPNTSANAAADPFNPASRVPSNAGSSSAIDSGAVNTFGAQPEAPPSSIDATTESMTAEAESLDGEGPVGANQVSLGLQSETDRIAQREWLANEIRFFGTSTAIVCDLLVPAEQAESPSTSGLSTPVDPLGTDPMARGFASSATPQATPAPSVSGVFGSSMSGGGAMSAGFSNGLESAVIPEMTRRIVYLFTDPDTARRTGRPAGLIRCELTNQRLASIRVTAAETMDLFALLQPALGITPRMPNGTDTLDGLPTGVSEKGVASPAMATSLNEPSSNGLSPTDPLQSAMTLGTPAAPKIELEHLPEIISFKLRYFDGEGWHTTWDSREQRELPVAVEMRFRLAPLASATPALESGMLEPGIESTDGLTEDSTDSELAEQTLLESNANELSEADDPRRLSAQTRPVEDHRYVILLSSPPSLQTATDGSLSDEASEEAGDEAVDSLGDESGASEDAEWRESGAGEEGR